MKKKSQVKIIEPHNVKSVMEGIERAIAQGRVISLSQRLDKKTQNKLIINKN